MKISILIFLIFVSAITLADTVYKCVEPQTKRTIFQSTPCAMAQVETKVSATESRAPIPASMAPISKPNHQSEASAPWPEQGVRKIRKGSTDECKQMKSEKEKWCALRTELAKRWCDHYLVDYNDMCRWMER